MSNQPIPNAVRVQAASVKRPIIIKTAIVAAIILTILFCGTLLFINSSKNYVYTVEIGDKLVNVDQITFDSDSDILLKWFKNDLVPMLRKDKELEKY